MEYSKPYHEKIAVILLNYKSLDLVEQRITEIRRTDPEKQLLYIVVDNGSENTHALDEFDKNLPQNAILLRLEKNYGYAAGNNKGIEACRSMQITHMIVMNPDVTGLTLGKVHQLILAKTGLQNVAVVGPKIQGINPYIARPGILQLIFPFFSGTRSHPKSAKPTAVYRVSGSCLLADANIMDSVGGFDERTFLYFEELILAEKLRRLGLITLYCEDVEVRHHASTVINQHIAMKKYKYMYDSLIIYLRHYRGTSAFSSRLIGLMAITIRVFFNRLRGRK